MRKGVYKGLELHPTLMYSCHSFGRLYKLVLGHVNNEYEKSYKKDIKNLRSC